MPETMLEIALACIRRGWFVFPCWPGQKTPRIRGGNLSASNDAAKVRDWWAKWPDANVAISTKPSRLTVVDVDHGLANADEWAEWAESAGLPGTYTVRTGRRDGFGVQMYYSGDATSKAWETETHSGDIRGSWGYVMAAGCLHPSGSLYSVLLDMPIVPAPEWVNTVKKAVPKGRDGKPNAAWMDDGTDIVDHRNCHMISLLGRKRGEGFTDEQLQEYGAAVNDERLKPPLDEAELDHLVRQACKWPVGVPDPVVTIGGKPSPGPGIAAPVGPVDWRSHYHTFEQVSNAPRPRFLIDGFLQLQSITAVAAPVGQRKSIIGLNIAHCLCTREPLFDHFPANPECVPSRVLYLCPEMGLISFSDRVRKIGLMPHVCESFFVRTMNPVQETPGKRPDTLTLENLQEDEVRDAVVIIDTAVRFIQGDENSSADMRVFANSIFRLAEIGAAAVVVLFHSGKTTKEQPELTLENAMRGSGELGAFVTCCWATRLQLGEDEDEYRAKSYLRNVKPRDFEAKPFEVIGTRDAQDNVVNDCRMHWIDNGEAKVVLSQKAHGVKTDADGMEDLSVAVIKAHPEMKIRELQAAMKAAGIKKPRCPSWISTKRAELRGAGVHTE